MNAQNLLRIQKALSSSIIAVLCISCSVNIPQSYVQYVDLETKQVHPWPVITDENEDYKIEVEPLGNVDNTLVFDVGVTNKNFDTLFLEPRSWQLLYTSQLHNLEAPLDTLEALTPEEISLVYANLAEKLEAVENSKEAAVIIIGILLIVGLLIIAMNVDSDEGDCEDCDDCYAYDGGSYSSAGVYSGGSSNAVDEEIWYYKQRSREITGKNLDLIKLLKGEYANFQLYFNRFENMRRLKLVGAINHQPFEWNFIHSLNKAIPGPGESVR